MSVACITQLFTYKAKIREKPNVIYISFVISYTLNILMSLQIYFGGPDLQVLNHCTTLKKSYFSVIQKVAYHEPVLCLRGEIVIEEDCGMNEDRVKKNYSRRSFSSRQTIVVHTKASNSPCTLTCARKCTFDLSFTFVSPKSSKQLGRGEF